MKTGRIYMWGACRIRRSLLPALFRLAYQNRIKVLLQPCELQLSLCDLIQSNLQQTVLVKLAQVVYTWWWAAEYISQLQFHSAFKHKKKKTQSALNCPESSWRLYVKIHPVLTGYFVTTRYSLEVKLICYWFWVFFLCLNTSKINNSQSECNFGPLA